MQTCYNSTPTKYQWSQLSSLMDGKIKIKTFVECSILQGCANTHEWENACSKLQRNYTLFAAKIFFTNSQTWSTNNFYLKQLLTLVWEG